MDANRVILTGENPFIRLSSKDGDALATNAGFWRILFSPACAGHVLYIKSDVTDNAWRIYSYNIAMTRWQQSTAPRMLNAELEDSRIPVAGATFRRPIGDVRDFWTELR